MKPFGTDDDDIELNYVLDRNIRTSFALVNAAYDQVGEWGMRMDILCAQSGPPSGG